jgi:hypothetical protein
MRTSARVISGKGKQMGQAAASVAQSTRMDATLETRLILFMMMWFFV